ncbi:tape measure protein [Bosea thiooxidans]
MATDVEALSVLLEVQTQKFENAMRRQYAQFNRISKQLEDRATQMESNIGDSFGNLAKIIGGGAVINEVKKLADTWLEATNKIKSAGVDEAISGLVANQIADIATRSRSGFAEIADLYARLTRTGKAFSASQEDVATATETVAKALKISGASGSEVQSTLTQLGQALGSGRLQGDELRSLSENAPVVMAAIAKEFGVAQSALKDLGSQGLLVSDRVFKAIVNAAPEIDAAFGKTTASISDSFTLLENAALKFVGNSKQMGVAASATSGAIQLLAKNLDGVAVAATAVGAVIASRMIAAGLTPLVAQLGAAITAATATASGVAAVGTAAQLAGAGLGVLRTALALVGGPVGAAILGAGAAVAYFATQSKDGGEEAKRYAAALKGIEPPAGDAQRAIKAAGDEAESTAKKMRDAAQGELQRQLDKDRAAAESLETAIRSAAQAVSGPLASAGVGADEKKRGLDAVQRGLEGNEKAALAAARELEALGEVSPSFARAFSTLGEMLTKLAAVRKAAIDTQAAFGQATATNTKKDEQDALERSGFRPDNGKLPDAAASVAKDPVVSALRLQQKVRLAEMDKDKRELKEKTEEIWKEAMEAGSPVSMKQAGDAAQKILAAKAAEKKQPKGPKSDEDKAEDRLENYIMSLERQNKVLDAEIATFGKSNAERRAAIELAKAQVDLNDLDADTRKTLSDALVKEVKLSEEKRQALKKLEDQQRAVNDASKFFGDAITDSLEDLILNGAKAEDVMKNLVKQLAKAALQAAIMGSGPLAGLFGTSGSNGATGGIFGLIGGLFKGFDEGGWTGAGGKHQPAGVVHKGEYVFDQDSVRKAGGPRALEAMRRGLKGYAGGGFVGAMAGPSMPSVPSGLGGGGAPRIIVNNTQSQSVQATPKQESNGDITVLISAVEARMADNMLRGRGPLNAAIGAKAGNRQLRG